MEEIKQYKVGSHVFSSREEAEKFEAEQNREKKIIAYNHNLLNSAELKYIPIVRDGDLDIAHNCEDQYHYPYKLIFHGGNLRYVDEKIEIISEEKWLKQFVEEKMNYIIHVNELEVFLRAVTQFNKDNFVDSYDILASVANFQIQPEYIYD